ncbi:MAG: glycosyltransferase family 2 protein [Deltaproteobacteria bacterium]|jgi:glycosyltransferase involved in cell wall biosynthesis|nr:glycosyltransferase family 2 protein [Deltaproteobacteria bacterium]
MYIWGDKLKPTITAVVPYYNMGRYIADAVNSLLNQTWQDLDIIVVNDGSDEENTRALQQFEDNPRIKNIYQENRGGQIARSNGYRMAEGKYVIFLDADDTFESTFAEKAVAILETNQDICLVSCLGRFFGDRNGINKRQPYTVENILAGRSHSGAGMFRKSDWESMPGKDSNLPYGQDWDFWVSMIARGKKAYRIEEFLYNYRRHGDSIISRRRSRDKKKTDVIGTLLEKHKELYTQYPQVASELAAERTADIGFSMPRFMELKKQKYKLILFMASLPGFNKTLNKVAQKAGNKLDYFNSL